MDLLFGFLLVLGLIAIVGHFTWVLIARLFGYRLRAVRATIPLRPDMSHLRARRTRRRGQVRPLWIRWGRLVSGRRDCQHFCGT